MAERTRWIGVAARDHVDVGVAEGFVMFAHGKHAAALKVKPGDRFAYYAPMTGMGTGDTVRAFVAIGEVLDGEPEVHAMTATINGWRRRARYFRSHPADVYPLLDRLSFIHDRTHWGMAFRRSLFHVGADDFAIIADAMQADLAD
jgi:predicted RNA-binding protein